MLVSSTINLSARSSVHLLVIHHNDERVLVPVDLYTKYSDLQTFITKEWDLESKSTFFETDELDICAGKRVRIHEEAWSGIKEVVGNVYVHTREQRTNSHHQTESDSEEEEEVEKQMRPESQKGDYVVVTPNGSDRDHDAEKKRLKDIIAQIPPQRTPIGDSLNLFYEEESSVGRREQEQEKEHNRDPSFAKGNSNTAKSSRTASQATVQQTLPSIPTKQLNNSSTSTTASRLATSTIAPHLRATKDVKPKQDSIPPASDSTAISEDPERVLVVVEPPLDNIYEPRGFRVRREHSVRTVLKGACKAYKVDFLKVRLRMVIEDDDGEALSTVKCNETETMTSLKVEDNQRFLIEMINEETEDESDH